VPRPNDPCLIPVGGSGQVAAGVDPRDAWERCGKPKGEAGIQNIRKRAREERARPQAAPPPEPRRAASGPGRGVPKAGFRLRKEQRTVIVQQQKDLKQQYAQVYADATADWQRGEGVKCCCALSRALPPS